MQSVSRQPRFFPGRRHAMSLLEVVLAIAIFGTALVVIGQLLRIGNMSAASARDLTEAQRHCNNIMAEVGAGILPPDSTSGTPVEGAEGWQYSVTAEPITEEGLLSVTVTVEQDSKQHNRPISFNLVRWMVDPATTAAAKSEAEAASSTTSGSSTTPATGASSSAPSASAPAGGT